MSNACNLRNEKSLGRVYLGLKSNCPALYPTPHPLTSGVEVEAVVVPRHTCQGHDLEHNPGPRYNANISRDILFPVFGNQVLQ